MKCDNCGSAYNRDNDVPVKVKIEGGEWIDLCEGCFAEWERIKEKYILEDEV